MALLLRANLGSMPWDVFHQGLARITGLSFGTIAVIVGAAVLLAWIPLRQRPGLGTISNVVVIGLAADGWLAVLPEAGTMPTRIGYLTLGIGLNGVATALYIGARFGPGPRDGLMTGLAARGHSIRLVRTSIEIAVVGTGWLLGGTLGVGTIAYALSIGPLVQALLPLAMVAPERAPASATEEPAPAPA